ncbi:antibiotic biosynthesis monooxygenase [Devosia oryziradicis]|uniref:Antibiotic biosynthesis monooxygenase n=1 Tax=Devosia oryziradicis TaxID=2801335 RepID=A0ABX7BRQ7_9HYPH|nr:antibiotic biosynthesis monooxygenase [Devosia oryziradicis]QQR34612.1 antibiotic biosynthesis monooxygenase [Devosia oryziradicis]
MTDQPITRIARLEIDPAQLDKYLAYLTEEIEASIRLEPGVLMLHATARKDAPHSIELLEQYASAAAYQAHIGSPHFLKYKRGTADMVRRLELIEVEPILLAAKPTA